MITFVQKNRAFLENQADMLLEIFLMHGPDRVREYLEVECDADFGSVFDYLVFEKQILYTLVTRYDDFFGSILREYGPQHVRKALKIEEKKYDSAFAMILEYLGIARENLFLYVIREKAFLYEMMIAYDTATVRRFLCLEGVRYDDVWLKILDIFFEDASAKMMEMEKRAHVERLLELFAEGRQHQQILPFDDGYAPL